MGTARRTRGISAVVAVVIVALLAGACSKSSSSSSQTPTEKWATSVCTAGTTWVTEVKGLASQVTSVRSTDDLKKLTDQFTQDTQQLIDSLKKAGAPDTSAGTDAKNNIDKLQSTLEQEQKSIQKAMDSSSGGLAGAVQTGATVATSIATALTAVSTTYDSINASSAGDEIAKALQTVPACKTLKDSVSS